MAKKSDFDSILENPDRLQEFCTWFWNGKKGNKLIHLLNLNNECAVGSKIRRLHNWWPHIYCVVYNDKSNPGAANSIQWMYCKVGMTEKDTTTGRRNRMENVQDEIKKKTGKNSSVIFVLPVKDVDSRPNNEIEKSVREHIGWPVDKELARDCNFPVVTEWILTTQVYIDDIKEKIGESLEKKLVIDTELIREIPRFQGVENLLPSGLKKMENGKISL